MLSDLDRLVATENIKKTKATYWYAMDKKQWDVFASCFTTNALADYRGGRNPEHVADVAAADAGIAAGENAVMRGRETIAAWVGASVEGFLTVHQGHVPIIEVTGPDAATGIWPIFDYVDNGEKAAKGYGHYFETYRLEDGQWRIDTMFYIRMRVDGDLSELPTRP